MNDARDQSNGNAPGSDPLYQNDPRPSVGEPVLWIILFALAALVVWAFTQLPPG